MPLKDTLKVSNIIKVCHLVHMAFGFLVASNVSKKSLKSSKDNKNGKGSH
jgi:hypothetical protein